MVKLSLPESASAMSLKDCRLMLTGQMGTKAQCKQLFRDRLAMEGIIRGSIPVGKPVGDSNSRHDNDTNNKTITNELNKTNTNNKSRSSSKSSSSKEMKPLSRCNAEELGSYLLALEVFDN